MLREDPAIVGSRLTALGLSRGTNAPELLFCSWKVGLDPDTVLRYGCILTVAVCHSRCLGAFSNAPSRAQLLIEELTSRVWDGRDAGARVRPGHSHGS